MKKGLKKAAVSAKDILVGTLRNMSPDAVGKRYKAVDDAKRARNLEMINENFGNVENYQKMFNSPEDQKLFDPPYARVLRPLFERLVAARNRLKND